MIETDQAFAIYSFNKDICYIEDIYVRPECRRDGVARQMADWIATKAKDLGCKKLMGSVAPSAKGSQASLEVLLAYGMKLHSAQYDMIYMIKEL